MKIDFSRRRGVIYKKVGRILIAESMAHSVKIKAQSSELKAQKKVGTPD